MKKVLFISAVFILMNSCSATVETNTIEKKVFVCPSCYKEYDNIVIRGGCYKEDTGYASLWQRIGKPKYAGHGYMDSETYQGIRLVKRA